jgi:hypothetical protein
MAAGSGFAIVGGDHGHPEGVRYGAMESMRKARRSLRALKEGTVRWLGIKFKAVWNDDVDAAEHISKPFLAAEQRLEKITLERK